MQQWAIANAFGVDNLKLQDADARAPGPGEVAVRVRAVSLNYRDWLTLAGQYNPRQPLPLVPCSDGAGEIEAVGPGVTEWAVGDRVCSLFFQDWSCGRPSRKQLRSTLGGPLQGMLTQRAVLSAQGIARVPSHLSWEEAACLPCAGLTAWSAMVTQARLSPGERVLLIGTGGVSIFALQFARLLGLRTALISSDDAKLARAGADLSVSYKTTPQWSKSVLEWTGGEGVDLVVEVGGAGTLAQSLRCLRPFGQVSLIGNLAGAEMPINVLPILMTNLRVQGILVGHREGFCAMARAIEHAALRPQVDRAFPFSEAPQAFGALANGSHFGKLVILTEGG